MQVNGMELTQEMTPMCNDKKRPTTKNCAKKQVKF